MNNIFPNLSLSKEAAEWISAANLEDVALAIEFGYVAAEKFNKKISNKKQKISTVEQGQLGEKYVDNIMRGYFDTVQNVAGSSLNGDLILHINHKKIMVEVKNYTNTVPAGGVTKFIRDLNAINADGGVFISLNSPISCIDNFTVKYEHINGKTVPTIYISSSDKDLIITAFNVVISLLAAFDYVNSDMKYKDKIINNIYEINNNLSDISKIRCELQSKINDITAALSITNINFAVAESKILNIINNIRGELFSATSPHLANMIVELQKNITFGKQSTNVQNYVIELMSDVHHLCGDMNTFWKISQKKYTNCFSGIEFNILSKVSISVPRGRISQDTLLYALNYFNDVNVTFLQLTIEITDLTFDWIKNNLIK